MSYFKKFDKSFYIACKKYGPCYRTIIALGFFDYFLRCEDEKDTLEEIYKFHDAVVSNTRYKLQYCCIPEEIDDCSEFYPIEMDENNIGYLYIDHTHNCYPLVIYPITHKQNNAPRTTAFNESVTDIYNNHLVLINLFKKYHWIRYEQLTDEELEKELSNFQNDLHCFLNEK